jgi:hypothetical protein
VLADAEDSLYCEFADPEQYRSYYDLVADPWQLANVFGTLSTEQRKTLAARLEQYRQCQGVGCRSL